MLSNILVQQKSISLGYDNTLNLCIGQCDANAFSH